MNYKDIHIGELIEKRLAETKIEISRVCSFLHSSEKEIYEMFKCKNLNTSILLRWSKLLEYDFFRIYSQHLILHAPIAKLSTEKSNEKVKSNMPQFRKNIYTREVIYFILELIETKEKTVLQVINDYNIPKTTLYKWIRKYKI
ncbi:transposase [Epilithonimonas xixisoli]|uniref:Uncharacterized protein n=1 Tax=Epilithonimonas xixisoli TaxID=1476462 RepID=A0A4R8IA20_9FLAO|nr:transposase [Epilithonimonas xixisoli]TDX86938.1 hypothetical protein B0I22_1101 [Epilithonimonas xixisoli]